MLNRFACPYDKKITIEKEDITGDSSITEKPDVDYLAFAVEVGRRKKKDRIKVEDMRVY